MHRTARGPGALLQMPHAEARSASRAAALNPVTGRVRLNLRIRVKVRVGPQFVVEGGELCPE